jgi:BASS family bile acid:Na+ symporter
MRKYLFTLAVAVAAVLAAFFPEPFLSVGGWPLKGLILPLLQLIMFGMGATMRLQDFCTVLRMPRAVAVGLLAQYSIMPLLGFGLAQAFRLPPEIAAGVVLIGCSPSGLASNVMSYLAKANVALSITLTSLATLLSPILTPALMQLLAGQLVEVRPFDMMQDIAEMILLPVAAGLIVSHLLGGRAGWLKRQLPLLSMAGIVVIILVVTAAGHAPLRQVGWQLLFVALLHNGLGYLLGYGAARLAGLDEQSCRTVSIEVGLQNAGIASGVALKLGKLATMGLAAVLFGPLMNFTGSLLAHAWGKRTPQ